MRLRKIQKRLAILMGIAAICPTLIAQTASTVKQEDVIAAKNVVVESVAQEDIKYLTNEEMMAKIQKEGISIGGSQTMGNIKVTLENIWTDRYTYRVLIAVEHIDKTPFSEATLIHFGPGENISSKTTYEKRQLRKQQREESAEAIPYFTGMGSGSVEECHIKGIPNYKKYFIIDGSTYKTLEEDLVISLEDYQELAKKCYDSKIDLADYLSQHKNDVLKTVPNEIEIDEDVEEYLETLKKDDPAAYEEAYKEYVEELKRRPKKFLKDNGLKLQLIDGVEDCYITDIGFIDDLLHIKFRGDEEKRYALDFHNDKTGLGGYYGYGESCGVESGMKMQEKYEIYDVKNIEELKQYQLQIRTVEKLAEVKGEFTFKLKNKLAAENKTAVNKKVQLNKETQGVLKNIIQTKLSLILEFKDVKMENTEELEGAQSLTIIFKDGSKEEICESASIYNKEEATLIYDISAMKQEIAKVMLGDLELVSYK